MYGANTSWLDVTDKVRKAVGNKANWSATVRTKDLGEPAPGFPGPRALIVRFRVNDRIKQVRVKRGGRFVAPGRRGDEVRVPAGAARDAYGNSNSNAVGFSR